MIKYDEKVKKRETNGAREGPTVGRESACIVITRPATCDWSDDSRLYTVCLLFRSQPGHIQRFCVILEVGPVYNFSQHSSQHSIKWPHTRLTTMCTRSWAALRGWDPPSYGRSNVFSNLWFRYVPATAAADGITRIQSLAAEQLLPGQAVRSIRAGGTYHLSQYKSKLPGNSPLPNLGEPPCWTSSLRPSASVGVGERKEERGCRAIEENHGITEGAKER